MAANSTIGIGWGFGAAGVSCIFFGTNFVPVKRFETGDGLFFQFIMCNAILLVGIILNGVRQSVFYPSVMIGGAMWATGNICVIPIIKTIGLGLGILLWATINTICGWASGRFGLFGLTSEIPKNESLNYVGVVLCAASGILYMFVKPAVSETRDTYDQLETSFADRDNALFSGSHQEENSTKEIPVPINDSDGHQEIWDVMSPMKKRIIGCSLAVFSGVMYGFQFVPYLKISESAGHSVEALDYVFAQFIGTYTASLTFFAVYCLYKRNVPVLFPKAVLPAIACGLMWAVADVCWFIANEALGETISFPIISTSPPIVANLWTILLFKEITGWRNFLVLGLAFIVTCSGIVLIVLSKV